MIKLLGGNKNPEAAIEEYTTAWQSFITAHNLQDFEGTIKSQAIGWKVNDKQLILDNIKLLEDIIEQIHIGVVNERWIASIVTTQPIINGVRIIKMLERRQKAKDTLGLDHMDYKVADINSTINALRGKGIISVKKEHNDVHEWLSLRFGKDNQYEAKFVDHIVLQVAIKELDAAVNELDH